MLKDWQQTKTKSYGYKEMQKLNKVIKSTFGRKVYHEMNNIIIYVYATQESVQKTHRWKETRVGVCWLPIWKR